MHQVYITNILLNIYYTHIQYIVLLNVFQDNGIKEFELSSGHEYPSNGRLENAHPYSRSSVCCSQGHQVTVVWGATSVVRSWNPWHAWVSLAYQLLKDG